MLLLLVLLAAAAQGQFLVGRGIADITGLISEGILYGYANPDQDARGLQTRQFARTFIFADEDGDNRVVVCTAEISLPTEALRREVLEKLESVFGDLYNENNVMITPTHSHSTPGGQNEYWMYQAPSGGFVQPTFDAYANGIAKSIELAHADLQPADVMVTQDELLDTTISRSPYSYDQNPQEEQDKYDHNVDKTMTVVKVVSEGGQEMGMLNFFPIHTTSIKNFNKLVSSDNKGIASILFERYYNPGSKPGQASVLGLFAQTAEGDVTPNVRGDLCDDTFEPCSYNRSTCPEAPNNPTLCNSYGLTGDMFVDCAQAGINQFLKAVELYDQAEDAVLGPVGFRHVYVNMSDVLVGEDEDGNELTTCKPAMGYAFGAGATDGPGIPPFTQGELEGIDAIEENIERLFPRSEELKECHAPKPVLLPTGEIQFPYPWQPEVVPFQLFRIGQILLIGCPAEITTMSGRRIMDTVIKAMEDAGDEGDFIPIIMAMANTFTSYVTTFEEYSVQRYEGGSTSYGPHTLAAYQLIFTDLATALATGEDVEEGPEPLDLRGFPADALDPLLRDVPLEGTDFGDCVEQPDAQYEQGSEASALFISGNPRNDLKTDSTFLTVERFVDDDWAVELVDGDFETRMYWDSSCHDVRFPNRTGCNVQQQGNATIVWEIADDQPTGTYRIGHFGHANTEDGVIEFSGYSESFEVVAASRKISWRKRGLHKKLDKHELDKGFLASLGRLGMKRKNLEPYWEF